MWCSSVLSRCTLAAADNVLTLYMHHRDMKGDGFAKARYLCYGYILLERCLSMATARTACRSRARRSRASTPPAPAMRGPIPHGCDPPPCMLVATPQIGAALPPLAFPLRLLARPSEALRLSGHSARDRSVVDLWRCARPSQNGPKRMRPRLGRVSVRCVLWGSGGRNAQPFF